jgi:hypothetical protein
VRVILKAWSSNPDSNGGCDFAAVEITPEFAKHALRRIEVLREQKALDSAIDETYYWDSAIEFFSPWSGVASQTEGAETACLKLEQELDSLQVERHEVVTAAHGLTVPQSQIARVECAQMVVRLRGIAFTAVPKHTDFYVTTAEIPIEVLQQSTASACD